MSFKNELVQTISDLEQNDWTGTYDDGTPIVWHNEDLSKMSHNEIENFMAGDLSLAHVYFKDLNVVKYIRDENYGSMDVIGNGFYNTINMCPQ